MSEAAQQVAGAEKAIESLLVTCFRFVAFQVQFGHTTQAARRLNSWPLGCNRVEQKSQGNCLWKTGITDMAIHRLRFHDTVLECEQAKRGALRWAVGLQDSLRSSTWRLWGNKKGDIYISTRSLGGILKASFHRDGNCHVGFTSQYVETARKRFSNVQSRHWDRWTIPDDPIVRVVQIAVPASELREFSSEEAPQMKWIPVPPSGSVSVVSVFIAQPGVEMKWPGSAHGAKPLGVILTARRTTWVVYAQNPIDEDTRDWIERYREKVASLPGVADAPREPSVRTILWGFREKHDRFFIELAWS